MNTVIADDRCRVKLPEGYVPGERFDVSIDSQGNVVYRKIAVVSSEVGNVPFAKITEGEDGLPVIEMPEVSSSQVARIVREERDAR